MKNMLIQSALLLLAGALFLIAAPQYAVAARSADAGSALEVVCGIPAFIFTFAGCAGIISAVVISVVAQDKRK